MNGKYVLYVDARIAVFGAIGEIKTPAEIQVVNQNIEF
jgi:hypothetical protein